MVRLQTLDLRIGVRVPASQPVIQDHFACVGSPKTRVATPASKGDSTSETQKQSCALS